MHDWFLLGTGGKVNFWRLFEQTTSLHCEKKCQEKAIYVDQHDFSGICMIFLLLSQKDKKLTRKFTFTKDAGTSSKKSVTFSRYSKIYDGMNRKLESKNM